MNKIDVFSMLGKICGFNAFEAKAKLEATKLSKEEIFKVIHNSNDCIKDNGFGELKTTLDFKNSLDDSVDEIFDTKYYSRLHTLMEEFEEDIINHMMLEFPIFNHTFNKENKFSSLLFENISFNNKKVIYSNKVFEDLSDCGLSWDTRVLKLRIKRIVKNQLKMIDKDIDSLYKKEV